MIFSPTSIINKYAKPTRWCVYSINIWSQIHLLLKTCSITKIRSTAQVNLSPLPLNIFYFYWSLQWTVQFLHRSVLSFGELYYRSSWAIGSSEYSSIPCESMETMSCFDQVFASYLLLSVSKLRANTVLFKKKTCVPNVYRDFYTYFSLWLLTKSISF